MGKCVLARVDFRLIHGQVITKWVKKTGAEMIVIADDALAKDDFMGRIYANSAPKGIKVKIDTVEETAQKWKENQYGDVNIMVLFKNLPACYRAIENGMDIKEVQLGGAPNEPGKKKVTGEIFLNTEETAMLGKMNENGIRVYIQAVPEKPVTEYEGILKKIR